MALKQLMLAKKIEQRKSLLAELVKNEESYTTRSAELEKAIEEANSDEEVQTVEGEIEKLEGEKSENDEKKSKLDAEIQELEGELEELNQQAPKNDDGQRSSAPETQTKTIIVEGETRMKVNKGFFKGQERSAATVFVERQEVKDFLTSIRERSVPKENQMKQRAVEGAGLGIPDTVLGLIRDNLHRYSKLINKVNVRGLKGTSRTNIVGDIPEAVWTEACAKLNELALRFYQVEMDGYKVGGYIPVCNATLEDSDFNLANEIFDALGQALGLAIDKAILYGTGVKMPVGIVTRLAEIAQPAYWGTNERAWSNLSATNVGQVTGADAKELFANLVRFSGKAKGNYGNGQKFWAMNENTYTEIQAQMVEFNAAGAIVSSVNGTMPVIGGDIVVLPFMADGDIVGGYGAHYILAERSGSTFAQSEHVQFIEDNTVYKATARYDGRPISGNGFVAMNIMGAAPTTTVTFAPDEANTEAPAV
ncbi:phage major capsid protein [Mesobacillus subterraneus]|uniref:phage major capsid protein n=1 Tax=Mesobacillus subterraneus TaxID=285983 RepID=UPI00203D70CA|nr:phage major capsid protein [Mesobacillus subterraneus]MCM3665516.1 phage major capsid protein [Mesobacillus subterraneus]MCM3686075.1 phage major capsid protein [Mesobacillus subterraneus]